MPSVEKSTNNATESAKTSRPRRMAGNSRLNGSKPAEETARRGLSAEERRELIARTAYFRAAARGFSPGQEWDDWLAAEAEIESAITSGK